MYTLIYNGISLLPKCYELEQNLLQFLQPLKFSKHEHQKNIKTKKSALKKIIPSNINKIEIDFDIHKGLKTLVE